MNSSEGLIFVGAMMKPVGWCPRMLLGVRQLCCEVAAPISKNGEDIYINNCFVLLVELKD